MTNKIKLTPARIQAAVCPSAKADITLWDAEALGLGLRLYRGGQKSWWFQFRIDGKAARIKIGDADTKAGWPIGMAREEARRLKVLVDKGEDPRAERKAKTEERDKLQDQAQKEALTLGEAWEKYVEEHENGWSKSHLRDHHAMMREPGQPTRGTRSKQTIAGPLWSLAHERLIDVPARLESWLKKESATRPTSARKAFVLLKTCMAWHGVEISEALDNKTQRRIKRALPKPQIKDDVLDASQLSAWWSEVDKLPFVSRAYLMSLLLLGCRREELAQLRWADVDLKWNRLTVNDKIEATRVIPLPSPVKALMLDLKHRGEVVDLEREGDRLKRARVTGSDEDAGVGDLELVFRGIRGHGGPSIVHKHHTRAAEAAGLPHMTQHGLRRTFITLGEEAGIPSGAVAQICGHKPSALVERSYKRRSLDKLTEYHEQLAAWILTQAGVVIEPSNTQDDRTLKAVKG